MQTTIKSKALNRALTFSRPGSDYVYVDLNGRPGTLGLQICDGGRLMGNTIMFSGDDEARFAALCRRWYRAHIARQQVQA